MKLPTNDKAHETKWRRWSQSACKYRLMLFQNEKFDAEWVCLCEFESATATEYCAAVV